MNEETVSLLRAAIDAYLMHRVRGTLEPSERPLPYDFDEIDRVQWRVLGHTMVVDELRELTNCMNEWQLSLRRWQAWNSVLLSFGEQDAWTVRREFVEVLAHYCLLQPSAVRDKFTFVVTNAMHQVHLASDVDYRDVLVGDPAEPGQRLRYPSRREKEERLAGVIKGFPGATPFLHKLRSLDDEACRQQISDYRNLVSHSIGPRLGIGLTRAVVRRVEPATELAQQPDGTFRLTPVAGRLAVSYGLGGTEPLDMESAWSVCFTQYRRARLCYDQYRALLRAGLAGMTPANPAPVEISGGAGDAEP